MLIKHGVFQVTPFVYLSVSLLCILLVSGNGNNQKQDNDSPLICVIVRTYWGHGSKGDMALQTFLKSLQTQSYQNWEAILLVMDKEPFQDLHQIVRNISDDRIWVFAEWIGSPYAPKQPDGMQWMLNYHNKLYNLTDEAIRVCPQKSEWVLVTNGDNLYAKNLFELVAASHDAELIALDYYSRYQRCTGIPCERFQQEDGAPPCKANHLEWCRTDLGANIMRLPRLKKENQRFGLLDDSGRFTGHDGIMAQKLVEAGWKVKHFSNTCMFDHSPSPQQCAQQGNIWDDSQANSQEHTGGRCMTDKAAEIYLKEHPDTLEVVEIQVSNDGNLHNYYNSSNQRTTLQCVRKKGVEEKLSLMRFFGPVCAEDMDKSAFEGTNWQLTPVGFQATITTYRNIYPDPPPRNSTRTASYRKRYYGPKNTGDTIWAKTE
eukprot:TRINITY_DN288_c1_g1_i1.p1 TRINITY_DN288_c1_g1~~TRINITY_DN288_c1_g1_i1.p1  ORF type:complete len:439 (+),score=23.23 TRINITY_DN288_c1_g1_i1:29-1318(+)